MRKQLLALAIAGGCWTCLPARAALTFYTDASTFQAANLQLTTETFQAANVTPGVFQSISSPLSSDTISTGFPAGSFAPGFTMWGDSYVVDNGTIPGTTKAVGSAMMALWFDSSAVGMNFFVSNAPGSISSDTLYLSIFGPTGPIGDQNVPVSGSNTFFGVISTADPIKDIQIASLHSSTFWVDNLSFQPAPEPGSLSLFALAIASLPIRSKS